MKIKYRPHRGTLAEAMAELKEFSSIEEMFNSIRCDHPNAFAFSDIYISYYCYDSRIDWETYVVSVGKYCGENYMEKYKHPQAIGFCTFESEG